MQGLITYYPMIMDVPDKPASLILASAAYLTVLSPGDTSWSAPYSGFWSFVARGCGAWRGGSGAAAKRTVYLTAGQAISCSIGNQMRNPSTTTAPPAAETTVNFPDGLQMVAGGGYVDGAGGTASGGDINVSGDSSGVAPAIDTFPAVNFTQVPGTADSYAGRPPGVGGTGYGIGPGPGVLYIYSTAQ